MNQYITNNKPNENLIYVLDYLGISIDEFLEMSDEKIISIYKKSADALNDGVMTKSGNNTKERTTPHAGGNKKTMGGGWNGTITEIGFADSGSKSRYFDIDVWGEKFGLLQFPKASKSERNEGCEGLEAKRGGSMIANTGETMGLGGASLKGEPKEKQPTGNHHPTIKPVHLMAWLVRLVSKEGDTVLDPFMGSGTTGVSATKLNRNFIGIELDKDYFEIAQKRIEAAEPKRDLFS